MRKPRIIPYMDPYNMAPSHRFPFKAFVSAICAQKEAFCRNYFGHTACYAYGSFPFISLKAALTCLKGNPGR